MPKVYVLRKNFMLAVIMADSKDEALQLLKKSDRDDFFSEITSNDLEEKSSDFKGVVTACSC